MKVFVRKDEVKESGEFLLPSIVALQATEKELESLKGENMSFHKVVVQFEVLCPNDEARDSIHNASLADIHHMTMDGDCSGRFLEASADEKLSPEEAAKALIEQGSDPEFFGIDENGNQIDD